MSTPSDIPETPDWAIEHARAALRLGKSVPETQQLLIAHGVSPAAAEAVVMGIVEERVQQQVEPQVRNARRQSLHRALSAAVGAGCVLLGFRFGTATAAWTLLAVLMPLACVWFPDEMVLSLRGRLAGGWSGVPPPGGLAPTGRMVALARDFRVPARTRRPCQSVRWLPVSPAASIKPSLIRRSPTAPPP
jgi:hypothetical protein